MPGENSINEWFQLNGLPSAQNNTRINGKKQQQQSFQSAAHYYYYYLQRAIVLNISADLRSINKNGLKEVMYI